MKSHQNLNNPEFIKKLRSDFLENGYIYYPNFLNKEEISLVKSKVATFIETKVSKMANKDVYFEDINDKSTLKQLQRIYEFDSFFYDMLFGSKFEKLASILLDDGVKGKNIQYFNKPPLIGKPTPPHQDGFYFMLEPNEAVTMWMPLEPVDEENGCVRYIAKSHLKGMRPHNKTSTLGFSQGISDYGKFEKESDEIFFETNPGDLLVHHSLTIHRADGNSSSQRTRKALGFIYYSNKAFEDIERHKSYAKELSKDLAQENKI